MLMVVFQRLDPPGAETACAGLIRCRSAPLTVQPSFCVEVCPGPSELDECRACSLECRLYGSRIVVLQPVCVASLSRIASAKAFANS